MDNIKLVCEGAEENWIEFKPTITPRQINDYLEAISKNDEDALAKVYRETIVDCCLVVGDDVARGLDAVQELRSEDMPVMLTVFWARAFGTAVKEARGLGNPQRRS